MLCWWFNEAKLWTKECNLTWVSDECCGCNGFRLSVTNGGVRVVSVLHPQLSSETLELSILSFQFLLHWINYWTNSITRHVFIIRGITDVLLHLKIRCYWCNKDMVSSYIHNVRFSELFSKRIMDQCVCDSQMLLVGT